MLRNLFEFTVAAVLEIGGCFAFWVWLKNGRPVSVAALGVVSLIGFATMLARVDAPFAGRAYAAYGGVYIAASLVWLWLIEKQRPTVPDVLGAALAITGAVVIVAAAYRR